MDVCSRRNCMYVHVIVYIYTYPHVIYLNTIDIAGEWIYVQEEEKITK